MQLQLQGCVLDLSGVSLPRPPTPVFLSSSRCSVAAAHQAGGRHRLLQEQPQGFVSQSVGSSPTCSWDEYDNIAADVDQYAAAYPAKRPGSLCGV